MRTIRAWRSAKCPGASGQPRDAEDVRAEVVVEQRDHPDGVCVVPSRERPRCSSAAPRPRTAPGGGRAAQTPGHRGSATMNRTGGPAARQVGDREQQRVSPNASGTAIAMISTAPIAANISEPLPVLLRGHVVREPRVRRPRPPERRQDEHPAAQAVPVRVVRHQRGDLGDREDEHQVEEQLERGYPLFLHGCHPGRTNVASSAGRRRRNKLGADANLACCRAPGRSRGLRDRARHRRRRPEGLHSGTGSARTWRCGESRTAPTATSGSARSRRRRRPDHPRRRHHGVHGRLSDGEPAGIVSGPRRQPLVRRWPAGTAPSRDHPGGRRSPSTRSRRPPTRPRSRRAPTATSGSPSPAANRSAGSRRAAHHRVPRSPRRTGPRHRGRARRQPLVHRGRRQQDRPDHPAGAITEFPAGRGGSSPQASRRARRQPLVHRERPRQRSAGSRPTA